MQGKFNFLRIVGNITIVFYKRRTDFNGECKFGNRQFMYKAWNNGRGFNTGTDKVQENGSDLRPDHLSGSDFTDRFVLQEVFTKADTIRRGRSRDTSGKTFSGYSVSDDNGDNTDFIFWSNTQFSGMDGES